MPPFTPVDAHLARLAAERPGAAALHVPLGRGRRAGESPHRAVTFFDLNATVASYGAGLAALGIGRASRVALMVPPGADFVALTFALLRAGAVPVMIDPGMGARNVGRCLADAEPEAFIGVPKAHLARRLFGWGRATVRVTVNVGRLRLGCTASTRDLVSANVAPESPQVAPGDLAAILFTSGSTGVAKGAIYTHGIFAAQVEMLRKVYGIEPGEVDFCTFPLFALFGPALGMTCVVPDMNASRPATIDPLKALAQMRQFGVTNLFGSPAVLRRLGEVAGTQPKVSTLRRVLSAGAPVPAPVIEKVLPLLPDGVEVFTPYGATEALPVANVGSREILAETAAKTAEGAGVCVGRPFPGIDVCIIAITDEPIDTWAGVRELPAGEIGEICVRGPIVTRGYVNRPEQTRGAKIGGGLQSSPHAPRVDSFPHSGRENPHAERADYSEDLWHRMGDVGYIGEDGRLWYCGRKSHRVETPEGTLFTECVEGIFNGVPRVGRTALVGVRRNGVTRPVLCVESWNPDVLSQLPRVAAAQPMTAGISTFLWHPGFPVDVRHNAKIFREKLALWADRQLGPRWNGGPAS